MRRVLLPRLHLTAVVLLATTCGQNRDAAPASLRDVLASPGLGLEVPRAGPSQFRVSDDGDFVWGQPPTRRAPLPVGVQRLEVGGGVELALGARRGTVRLSDASSGSVALRPLEGPDGFASWGPGEASGAAVVYPSPDGHSALVERALETGVKEDIVLTRSLGDALRFAWELDLGEGLEARLEGDGSVGLYAPRREHELRFRIAAPVVKVARGDQAASARYSLGEPVGGKVVLTLEVSGLAQLSYPLSIDPTLTVMTAQLGLGGNLESGVDQLAAGVKRNRPRSGLGAWASTTALGMARSQHSTLAYNGYLYVSGGTNGAPLSDVQVAPINADGTLGAWAATTPLPSARRSHATVAWNGFFYVIGGNTSLAEVHVAPINSNGTLGAFTATTSLPNGRGGHAAVAANGSLYVLGGYDGSTYRNDVQAAPLNGNGTLGAFTSTSAFSTGRAGHGAVVWNGWLYLSGGSSGAGAHYADLQRAAINADGSLGAFTNLGSFSTARSSHTALVSNGYLYIIGGFNGVYLNDVQAAALQPNGALGSFSTSTLPAPARSQHASAAWNGRLYVTGGFRTSTPNYLDTVEYASVITNGAVPPFSATNALTAARSNHATVASNGFLYLVGGSTTAAQNDVQYATLNPNGSLGPFNPTSSFVTARAMHCAVSYNGYLYVLGGISGSTYLNDVQRARLNADGTLQAFENPGPAAAPRSFSTPRTRFGCVAAAGYLYVLGGYTGAAYLNNVQRAPISADGTLGFFSATTSLPATRWAPAAVAYNGFLYVLGGYNGTFTNEVLRASIDPATGALSAFTAMASFTTARYRHSAVAYLGRLYVIGGSSSSGVVDDVQVALINQDGSLGSFTPTQSLGVVRNDHSALAWGGWLYVVGGHNGSNSLDSVERTFISDEGLLGAFTATTNLTTPRATFGSAIANNYLYVVGGVSGITAQASVEFALINPSGSLATFSNTSPLPSARAFVSAVAHNGYLYATGGSNSAGTVIAEVQVAPINANGTLGAFSATTPLPSPRRSHSTVVWNNRLYVVGGSDGTTANTTVQSAPIAANGTLGAFTSTSSFANGREGQAALGYNGRLYVIGGSGATQLNDIQSAPFNADGSLGAFTLASGLPGGRFSHGAVALDGYLYVLGGFTTAGQADVLVAPIHANGSVGNFTGTSSLGTPPGANRRYGHGALLNAGSVYVVGGHDGAGHVSTVSYAPLRTPSAVGTFSRVIDFGAPSTATSLTVNSTASRGLVRLDYRTAPVSGVLGPSISRGVVTPGSPVALGGNGIRYVQVRLSFDDQLAAAVNPEATTERDLTSLSVDYTLDPVLAPAAITLPPRGTQTFVCSQGVGGYTFSLSTDNSGGGVVPGTGAYTAGTTGSVTDVVRCTDSSTASGTATVTVSAGVSISPSAPSRPPLGAQAFTASGGSGTAYAWSFVTNNSGGTLNPGTGAYTAGTTGSVVDTIRVVDSLLNVATTTITVTAPLVITPATVTLAPRATQSFSTTGGSATGITWVVSTNLSGGSIDASGQYTAGSTGGVTDVVRATDSLGNVATRNVTVTSGVSLSPSSATRPPRGTQVFTPSGGSGSGFTWDLATNSSGGSVTAGTYTAGNTGSVTDVVRVTDSLGNVATASVSVTAGVSASPTSATRPPRGAASFTASGGSGAAFTWSMQASPSGGNVTAGGNYTAGNTGSVTDVLLVTDSLGNTATVNVTVTSGVTIDPASASRPPSGTQLFTASNGSGAGYTWALTASGSGSPSITSGGLYTAGTLQGTDTVRATDSLGNTAFATVTVTNALAITPNAVTLAPRAAQTFSGSGGSGAGFTWALLTNNSGATFNPTTAAYQAGATGGVADTVRLTDSLGNTTQATITVTGAVTIAPATTMNLPPRGAVAFTAAGGSATGFTWAFVTNASGGTINPSTGAYQAGSTGNVTDVVGVTDSLGNVGSASVGVSAAISIAPLSVPPRGGFNLMAAGGSGLGYLWSFVTNASMGTLTLSGAYTAGRTGPVTDVVEVIDSLGNTARLAITVTAMVSISPSAPTVPPRGTILLIAAGGSGSGYSWFFTTNRSGANVSPTSGLYQAGATAGVVDDLQVVDSLGNVATAAVTVTDSLAITPQLPSVAPRQAVAFTAVNGAGTVTWRLTQFPSGGSIDLNTGAYVAGGAGGTVDTVQATDSNGNVASTQVTVTAGLAIAPATLSLSPLGTQQFTATGGLLDGGYTFSGTGGSGASIDAASGVYVAGARGRTTDLVEVRDGTNSVAAAMVTVGDGVAITPATAEVRSGERQTFAARGGTNAAFEWSLTTNASGGSIDPSTGEYLAGPVGNVTDDVSVRDSLGNTASAAVTVIAAAGQSTTPVAERPPANGWSCGCQSTSSAGPAAALVALAMLVTRRRRGARRANRLTARTAGAWAAVVMVCLTPALATGAPKKKATPAKVAPTPPVPAPVAPSPPVEEARPRAAPPTAPAPKGKPTVAVLDVEVTVPGEKLDASAFSDMVLTAVDSSQAFKVISAKEIVTMLGIERQKQLLGCSEETSCIGEIANALGSDYLLVASVGRVGENYLVSARLINGLSNKITARSTVQAKSANALLEAVWRATQLTLDGYGASLPATEAQAWAARPKPTPPASVVAVEEIPSRFGISAAAAFGYQPLSSQGNRGSLGAQVDLTFRRGRLDLAAGVIIAPSPGARVTATWALLDTRARVDVGLRGSVFPGLGLYGGGVTSGFEFGLHHNFALNARVAGEAYPIQGTVVLALLGAVGVAARF